MHFFLGANHKHFKYDIIRLRSYPTDQFKTAY